MRFEGRRGGDRGGGGFGGGRRFGGPRRFGGEDNTPKPVKVGEEYDVEINEVGSRGDGIARIKNFVVFINGAKQGEKTHIKITEVRHRFAVGERTEAGAAPAEASTEGMADTTEESIKIAEEEEGEEGESEEEAEEEELK